ncbi:dihydrofolate reductase family protein [Ruicaihuangia caeni]|uniref:dihydrofolate reductase family protein n=1 Tax=Ruicaihuangia caeni TaxID=3042517 RepID=UPI00338F7EF7
MVDFITTLDGYASGEGWPGFWGLEGPEYLEWLAGQDDDEYITLMGANTYRLMLNLGEDAEASPDAYSADEAASLTGLAAMPKVVFSSTLQPPLAWPNTQLVSRDAVEAVAEMKRTGEKPLRTLGSLTLCRSLMEARLVDRFRVVMFPVITGRTGEERIYDGYSDFLLDMVESRTFDGRLQLVEYIPTRLDGPLKR